MKKKLVLIDDFKRQTMSVQNGEHGFRKRIPVGYQIATFQIPRDVAKTWNEFQFGLDLFHLLFSQFDLRVEFLGICGDNIPRRSFLTFLAFRTCAYILTLRKEIVRFHCRCSRGSYEQIQARQSTLRTLG